MSITGLAARPSRRGAITRSGFGCRRRYRSQDHARPRWAGGRRSLDPAWRSSGPPGDDVAKIGMSDVAAAAGVSISTVSVVLNRVESARVHPQTRERIWKAAGDLGYVPNGLARGLRLQRSDVIGFVSDEVATTPYAG